MPQGEAAKTLRSKMYWVGLLYFAEGLPLGLFYDVFPVHFRQQGVELWEIGSMSLLGLAWTLKFLWAPAVDRYRHHRRWMLVVDLLMGGVLLLFAVHNDFGPWAWFAIGLFTLLSATNDIAIDGYTIEMLEKTEMGRANGLRIGFYRVGMLAAGFILMLSDRVGWGWTYLAAAGLLATLGMACTRAPPERAIIQSRQVGVRNELRNLLSHPFALGIVTAFLLGAIWLADHSVHWSANIPHFWWYPMGLAALVMAIGVRRRRSAPSEGSIRLSDGPLFGALFDMLQRPQMGAVIAFILLFKLGDAAMGFMVKPFWVDAGFSASAIGMVSVNLGLVLSIAGGIAGGWATDRMGIFTALWVLGLAQAVSNLVYAAAAWMIPVSPAPAILAPEHIALMYGASALESFTGGLGTAAFLAFLMAIVNRQHSATEYALLSSLFALSRSLAGWAGGFGAQEMGYAAYFLLTFFLAFPAYLLLPDVRRMLDFAQRTAQTQAAAGLALDAPSQRD